MGSSVSGAPGGGARAASAPPFRLPPLPLLPLPPLPLLPLERPRLAGACRKGTMLVGARSPFRRGPPRLCAPG